MECRHFVEGVGDGLHQRSLCRVLRLDRAEGAIRYEPAPPAIGLIVTKGLDVRYIRHRLEYARFRPRATCGVRGAAAASESDVRCGV